MEFCLGHAEEFDITVFICLDIFTLYNQIHEMSIQSFKNYANSLYRRESCGASQGEYTYQRRQKDEPRSIKETCRTNKDTLSTKEVHRHMFKGLGAKLACNLQVLCLPFHTSAIGG